jgi:hypothetical protein
MGTRLKHGREAVAGLLGVRLRMTKQCGRREEWEVEERIGTKAAPKVTDKRQAGRIAAE